jgi:hypothetical protein
VDAPPPEDYSRNRIHSILRKSMLSSKRNGVWFRLSREQRALFSLALNLRVKFESIALARALINILKSLREMGGGIFALMMRGSTLAWAFSAAATSWGNPNAKQWRNDKNYIAYLGGLFG